MKSDFEVKIKNVIKDGDIEFAFIIKELKHILKVFLIPLIYGMPDFYFSSKATIEEFGYLSSIVLIWFIGVIILFLLFIIFLLFDKIERNFFNSFYFAFILRRYILPFKISEIEGLDYNYIKDGYKDFKITNN